MMVTNDVTALRAIRIDTKTGKPRAHETRSCNRCNSSTANSAQNHEQQDRQDDRSERAHRFAEENLNLQPGQLPESTQHLLPLPSRESSGPSVSERHLPSWGGPSGSP